MSSEQGSAAKAFPRTSRLTEARDYQRVFAGARRLGDRNFTVLAVANDLSGPRLGLAVSKRNTPLAVGRNRLKRIIRESFRQHRQTLGSYDLVVIPKPGAAAVDNAALFRSLEQQWQRLLKA